MPCCERAHLIRLKGLPFEERTHSWELLLTQCRSIITQIHFKSWLIKSSKKTLALSATCFTSTLLRHNR
jgi:hypothetical protein